MGKNQKVSKQRWRTFLNTYKNRLRMQSHWCTAPSIQPPLLFCRYGIVWSYEKHKDCPGTQPKETTTITKGKELLCICNISCTERQASTQKIFQTASSSPVCWAVFHNHFFQTLKYQAHPHFLPFNFPGLATLHRLICSFSFGCFSFLILLLPSLLPSCLICLLLT